MINRQLGAAEPVDLIAEHHPLDELSPRCCIGPRRLPIERFSPSFAIGLRNKKQATIQVAFQKRGPYDELIKEFRSGYAFIFDITMDIGGSARMHRHRRCQQVQQNFTTAHGFKPLPSWQEAGIDREYREAMERVKSDIEQLRKSSQEAALYAIPFGFKVRCLFKMDYAEAEYIAKLRSG